MHRRGFILRSGVATLGLLAGGCAAQAGPSAAPPIRQRPRSLVPVRCAADRILRTTVGLRPHRDPGFRLEVERLDARTVIHHYGHGGAGLSLSWGTAALAADLALPHPERRAAVLGAGIIGLTTARQLQRRGFDITLYAQALPPDTTSNRASASFTPTAGLISEERRTPAWDEQFRQAVRIAYREHQQLAGPRYGVAWLNEYRLSDDPPLLGWNPVADLLPPSLETGTVLLGPGEHPFGSRYALERPTLRFEPGLYLDALLHDVLAAGGRLVVRRFEAPQELLLLPEPVIVNCTGLGASTLTHDPELVPVKGQLTLLLPQPEVTYLVGGMVPRSDGIALNGGMLRRDDWSLEVDPAFEAAVIRDFQALFGAMHPSGGSA